MQADRKNTQRERLTRAMVDVAVREGYARATIAATITAAGVSRRTFYEYFTDKDDCFLAAFAAIQQRLRAEVAGAVNAAPGEQAIDASIYALIAFAASQPQAALFLTNELLAGGPRTLDARDQGIGEIAELIEQAQQELAPGTATPDVPPRMVLGAIYRLLARRLRQGAHGTAEMPEGLVHWIKSYEWPIGEHRWRTLQAMRPAEPWAILPETQLREPPAPARGRRESAKHAAENQRQRMLYATAILAEEKGYGATTIADITERAGVNRRAFNAQFSGKHDALMAVIALGFQRTIAVTAGAFFSAAAWPDRIWEAGRAATEFLQSSPPLAHIGFVEPYAVGPDAAQQVEDSANAFTVFLHEGLRHAPHDGNAPNPLALEAIAASIFETGYLESRRDGSRNMPGLLPHVTFLCLAPIIGAAEANAFIEGRLKVD
jgi:AcrR family transcriptional regulator